VNGTGVPAVQSAVPALWCPAAGTPEHDKHEPLLQLLNQLFLLCGARQLEHLNMISMDRCSSCSISCSCSVVPGSWNT
jgi:hypothetical protein